MPRLSAAGAAQRRRSRRLRYATAIAAVLAIVGAFLGWLRGSVSVDSIAPWTTLPPWLAVAGLSLCVGLGILQVPHWRRRATPLAILAAAAAGIVGVGALGTYARWLLEDSPPLALELAGPLPPMAGLVILLLATAIRVSMRRGGESIAQALALVAGLIAYFELMRQWFGVAPLLGFARLLSMNAASALLVLALSAAVFSLRPHHGPVGLLLGEWVGSRMARALFGWALVVPPVLGWLRLQGELLGFYGTRLGLALFATSNVIVFLIVVHRSARQLERAERRSSRMAEQLSRKNDEHLLVVQSLPQLVWTCLPNGDCDFLSQRWLDYTGAPEAHQLGSGWVRFVHPEDLPAIDGQWQEAIRTGVPLNTEYRIRDRAGNYRWFLAQAVPLRDSDGQITRWFGSSTDIEDRKQADHQLRLRTAELKEAHAQMQAVFDAATLVSIVGFDPHGVIQIFSKGAERMFGYPAVEMVGKTTPQILYDPEETATRGEELSRQYGYPVRGFDAFIHAARIGNPETRPWTGIRKDGSRLNVLLSVTAVYGTSGDIRGYIGIGVDISDRVCLEQQLVEQNRALAAATAEAEAASRAKSEFLANMSHEIRTPMNGVIGMNGLLLDTDLSPDQKLFCDSVRASAESLLVIINDILDFSKIEAGKMAIEEVDFDLRSMLDSTLQLVMPQAEDKGLDLTCQLDPALPTHITSDPGRVRQVLLNLLGNAVKFTAAGEIHVAVAPCPDRPGQLRFAVTDTGIGIPLDRQHLLFRSFSQVDGSITRRFGGTGLGLAISRDLAALLGGEIGLSSVPGQGSTFWFTIRLNPAPLPSNTVEPRADLAGERILIVDDSPANQMLLSALILRWGGLHEVADRPEKAIKLLREAAQSGRPFRIALIDYRMPELNGDDLGRLIQADPDCQDTLMVLMTSVTRRGLAQRSQFVGFKAFLTKPIRPEDLRDALEIALGRQQQGSRAGGGHPIITEHVLDESRRNRGRILLAEDNRTNQMVAVALVKKLGYWIEAVANGSEALEALASAPYELVLMDCQMPEMDGFTATRLIREGGARVPNPQIPIIAITANTMAGDRERCLAAGMDDYLSKPIRASELTAVLERWMGKQTPQHVRAG